MNKSSPPNGRPRGPAINTRLENKARTQSKQRVSVRPRLVTEWSTAGSLSRPDTATVLCSDELTCLHGSTVQVSLQLRFSPTSGDAIVYPLPADTHGQLSNIAMGRGKNRQESSVEQGAVLGLVRVRLATERRRSV